MERMSRIWLTIILAHIAAAILTLEKYVTVGRGIIWKRRRGKRQLKLKGFMLLPDMIRNSS